MQKQYDPSNEMIVTRFGNGLKLVNPDYLLNGHHPNYSVANVLQLPCCVYFLNQDSVWEKTNDHDIEACGALSAHEVLGKSISHFASSKTAQIAILNDKMVMQSNNINFLEEDIIRHDGSLVKSVGIKFPWYGNKNQLIGLIGFSIIQDKHSLTDSLSQITQLGYLHPSVINQPDYPPLITTLDALSLTERETECLRLYVRGLSAKSISNQVFLSKRTVENYIQNIKSKLGVSTRAELIYKTVNFFPVNNYKIEN